MKMDQAEEESAPAKELYMIKVSAVVHSTGALLAAGARGAGTLSAGVAAVAALSRSENRGGRGA